MVDTPGGSDYAAEAASLHSSLLPRPRTIDQLREENALLQRLLVEMTAPQPTVREELESLDTRSFLKAFYSQRVQPIETGTEDSADAATADNVSEPPKMPKITRTSASGQPAVFAAFPEEIRGRQQDTKQPRRKLHDDVTKEMAWRPAGTTSRHESKPAIDKDSLRLRQRGANRSTSPNPIAVLPRIARAAPPPTPGQMPPGVNRYLQGPSPASASRQQQRQQRRSNSPPAVAVDKQLRQLHQAPDLDLDEGYFVGGAATEVDSYLSKLFGTQGQPAVIDSRFIDTVLSEAMTETPHATASTTVTSAVSASGMAVATAEETEGEGAQSVATTSELVYSDWVIVPAQRAVPSPVDHSELSPVSCDLVDGLSPNRPVIVAILASRRAAWKVDAVQLYDPQLFLAPLPPPPDKIVIRVLDPIDNAEASVNVNYRFMTTLLNDLVARHPALDVASHFHPTSLEWWRDNARFTIKLHLKPNGSFIVKISRQLLEKLVVTRAAAKSVLGLPVLRSDRDLGNWMTAARESSSTSSAVRAGGGSSSSDAAVLTGTTSSPSPTATRGGRARTRGKSSGRGKSESKSRSPSPPNHKTVDMAATAPEVDADVATLTVLGMHSGLGLEIGLPEESIEGGETETDGPLLVDVACEGRESEERLALQAAPGSPTPKTPISEKVAREAIKKGREHTSSSHKFRNRPMTDTELSLIHSPFAVPLVTDKMKKEGERIRRVQMGLSPLD